ncbi:MAG TPA: alpha/beta hydrolase-fold protein, partial [Polyangia bacterium]|nr:alpha/beta hydrolase-fold protein [Polyangia bacterium]
MARSFRWCALFAGTLFAVGCSEGTLGGPPAVGAHGTGGDGGGAAGSGGTGVPAFGTGGSGGVEIVDSGSGVDSPEVLRPPSDGASGVGYDSSAADPGTEGDGIFMIAGPYRGAPEFNRQAGAPQGKVIRFSIASSMIFPRASNRQVAVYVPAQYKTGTPAAVMVFQDGTNFYGFDSAVPIVLDNLIAKGSVPPIVGVFASNGGGDSVGSERGLEYDTVSGLYAEWADKELLPRVEMETKAQLPAQAVTFTKDPEGRGTMGGSSGGAASFSMAWWRPDLFRRVITFSGTYVAQVPASSPFPHGAWIYHDVDPYSADMPNGLIVQHCESAAGPKKTSAVEPCDTPLSKTACEAVTGCAWNTTRNKPIRVWHQSGSNDLGAGGQPSSYRNFNLANQRM